MIVSWTKRKNYFELSKCLVYLRQPRLAGHLDSWDVNWSTGHGRYCTIFWWLPAPGGTSRNKDGARACARGCRSEPHTSIMSSTCRVHVPRQAVRTWGGDWAIWKANSREPSLPSVVVDIIPKPKKNQTNKSFYATFTSTSECTAILLQYARVPPFLFSFRHCPASSNLALRLRLLNPQDLQR